LKKYETPNILMEKLTIFEKIADDCWATTSITFDILDDKYPAISTTKGQGQCGQFNEIQWIKDNYYHDSNATIPFKTQNLQNTLDKTHFQINPPTSGNPPQ